MNREYYKRINNLDIALEETNHKYIMIHQWAVDNSHKWGIASFKYDEDEDYWYLQTYGNFNPNVDWYDLVESCNKGLEKVKEVEILQMVICGDKEVIAEVIFKEDFEKYFERSDT